MNAMIKLLALVILPIALHAKASVAPSGAGTAESPYQIDSLPNLYWLSQTTSAWGSVFVQGKDIDASGISSWTPIGNETTAFTGTFNGQGHKITGVSIGQVPGPDVGLFGYVGTDGTLQGVVVENASILCDTAMVAGILVGENDGTVIDCRATGTIHGYSNVGGLVGYNGGTVSRCFSTGTVYASDTVGGLVGFSENATISESYSTASVKGYESVVGGLLGLNLGEVHSSYSAGKVSGSSSVGGLVGSNPVGIVSNSYWDTLTSGFGTGKGIGVDGNSQSPTGLSTAQMKRSANLSGLGSFDSVWSIRQDSTYPGLRAVADAPFAFSDTLAAWQPLESLKSLLANDFDLDSLKSLVLHVDSLSAGSTDSSTLVVLPSGAKSGDVLRVVYRAGIPQASTGDTLWGNQARSLVVVTFPRPSGSGTSADPFLIDSLPNLLWLSSTPSAWGSVFRQSSDINASVTSAWNNGAGFSPIGDSATPFTGSYHGQGHVISGLTIHRPLSNYVGLFGHLVGASLDSLGVASASVQGSTYVGILSGHDSASSVSYCHASGSDSGNLHVGGLVGLQTGSVITASYAVATVQGCAGGGCGGLVGHNDNGSTIAQSFSQGKVSASGNWVGGLVGVNMAATVVSSYSRDTVTAAASVGGLVGYNFTGTIRSSYSAGPVTSGGGLVGTNTGTVDSSFWDSTTSGQKTSNGGAARSTSLMKTQSTFIDSGWDFASTWAIISGMNNGYPVLQGLFTLPGSGTEADPYLVANYADLKAVGVGANSLSAVYRLTADIDASPSKTENGGSGFAPIDSFSGTFHGAGHKITGLTINRPSVELVGLFGYIDLLGVVDSLGLESGSVRGKAQVGFLAGMNRGSIKYSFETGSVSAAASSSYAGGLAGVTYGSYEHRANISHSYASGSVTLDLAGNVGGFVGHGLFTNISDCYATGAIIAKDTLVNAGGFIGSEEGGDTIRRCFATGPIRVIESPNNNVGGFGGLAAGSLIANSYWNTSSTGQASSFGSHLQSSLSVTGLDSAAMLRSSNFSSLDYDSTWFQYDGHTTPLLRAFLTPLSVTAKDTAKTYDGAAFSGGTGVSYSLALVVDSLVKGTLTYGGTSQGAVAVGQYAIVPEGLYSSQLGYLIRYNAGALAIASPPTGISSLNPLRLHTLGSLDLSAARILPSAAQGIASAQLGLSSCQEVDGCQSVGILLPEAGTISVHIFDLLGTPVISWSQSVDSSTLATLDATNDGRRVATLSWNLRAGNGVAVPAGVYLWKIEVETTSGQKLETVKKLGLR